MRSLVPVCALLALGCSSSLPVTDAATDGVLALDSGGDAGSGVDVVDAGSPTDHPDVWMGSDPVPLLDTGTVDASADVVSGDDAQPPPDVTEPVDTAPFDAVAVVDVPHEDTVDASAEDTPDVAVAVDVPEPMDVVDVADVQPDRPDVTDVPRDTGAQDAGPVTYDLNATRSALEVRAVFRRVSLKGELDCEATADMTACRVEGGTLNLSLRACGRTFTGLIPLGTTTGRLVTVTPGAPNATFDPGPVLAMGPSGGPRRNFRVGVAAPQNGATPGIAGLPGRTVDPARGDLWLLGCEVR